MIVACCRQVKADRLEAAVLHETLAVLRRGGLVALPTDTVYGLACDMRNPEAVRRLYHVKQRPAEKALPLLAADEAQVAACGAQWDEAARALARRYWPGALTIVLPTAQGWEGFRIPRHTVALSVLGAVGYPLRVTSANRSGLPPAMTAQAAEQALGEDVDVILDAGPAPGGTASTVIRVAGRRLTLLREGAVSAEALRAVARAEGLEWNET